MFFAKLIFITISCLFNKFLNCFFFLGFIPPTSGTAEVNGCDIHEDIQGVRESLGLCPQHNILFDTMTVKEHLVFFARVKRD